MPAPTSTACRLAPSSTGGHRRQGEGVDAVRQRVGKEGGMVRERERGRDRQTDRQTETERETERDRESDP